MRVIYKHVIYKLINDKNLLQSHVRQHVLISEWCEQVCWWLMNSMKKKKTVPCNVRRISLSGQVVKFPVEGAREIFILSFFSGWDGLFKLTSESAFCQWSQVIKIVPQNSFSLQYWLSCPLTLFCLLIDLICPLDSVQFSCYKLGP